MKDEIISAQKEKKKVQKDLDDLKDSNRQINNEDREISSCFCGDNVKLKLKNVETVSFFLLLTISLCNHYL
jgi:ribosomal protein S8E